MNTLVLGGTTFFGRAIVERLLDRGDRVTVFSRGRMQPEWWGSVDHAIGDRTDADALEQLRGRPFDAVIDNIAYTGDDVRALLDVVAPTVGRYVLTSSSAVYNTVRGYPPYAEDDVDLGFRPPEREADTPGWRYTVGKLTAEQALTGRGDVAWTIIRPPIVLGPNDPTGRGWYYFQRLLDGGPILLPCCGERSFRIVYSQDLARGYLAALRSPNARGRVYNIAQQEIVRLRDLLDAAARGLGIEPKLVTIDQRRLDDAGITGPYDRMANFVPAVDRAVRELGYRSTPFDRWVAETVRWYRDEYSGPESPGYDRRPVELELARDSTSH